jgi:hypothetical protein
VEGCGILECAGGVKIENFGLNFDFKNGKY